jgi:hypothetical protein
MWVGTHHDQVPAVEFYGSIWTFNGKLYSSAHSLDNDLISIDFGRREYYTTHVVQVFTSFKKCARTQG